jgi:hypothetical protein
MGKLGVVSEDIRESVTKREMGMRRGNVSVVSWVAWGRVFSIRKPYQVEFSNLVRQDDDRCQANVPASSIC